ncbi:hypothetical protein PHJA_001447000 [Phtheirospermum japonicum]|uniref:Uncharacterized protein n=1 Tax=Phtheirospermum japonicum TaxID=374723 RepID=A0A830BY18_9LAMI|nr:hypothetical protein PHJA_001447000 [Phtheirospermum japonicum]
MTSALELFYNRRSRVGRTPDPFDPSSDFGSHPHLDRTNRRHRTHNSPAAITLASIGSIQMAAIRCAALIITRDHSRYIALLLLPTLLK